MLTSHTEAVRERVFVTCKYGSFVEFKNEILVYNEVLIKKCVLCPVKYKFINIVMKCVEMMIYLVNLITNKNCAKLILIKVIVT